jgi:N-methylhydantoinase A
VLDRQRASDVVRDTVGSPLDLQEAQAGHAIVRVANANMANATKLISVGRGFDPRDFALVVFGGAGPLHGCDLASELDIPVVIFPRHPGIASAMGCLLVDIRHDLSRMCLFPVEQASTPRIEALFADLEAEARTRLADDGVATDAMRLRRTIDMRYAGQWRQLSIEMPPGRGVETVLTHFHAEHERAFAFRDDARPVEVYAARVVAEGGVLKPQSAVAKAVHDAVELPRPATHRPVYFSQRRLCRNARLLAQRERHRRATRLTRSC